ncbi:MAG: group III truncated hemoglobin [Chitinophagaceae bacterium]|nr:group III truncated hemoglobin [Chitinophagaceae bacterium]MCW5929045.1 group III truncated hemoglobin [Chitinophagaceae bacterium]
MKRTDIRNEADIQLLVDTFYEKVRVNPVIGYIFNDIAKVDWSHHLPKMYSFWGSILLGEHSYSGHPMTVHIALSKMTTLSEKEFSEWLLLFTQTVDELFAGETAHEAKLRAANIARLMLHKIKTASPGLNISSGK